MFTSWLGRSRSRAAGRPAARPTLLRLEDRTVPATIAGTVYADLNGNGLFDAGDTPVASSPVELRDSDGTVINSGVTGAAGTYSFATDNTANPAPTTLQRTVPVPPTATNFTTTVSVPRFDPAFGTLTGVRVDLAASVQGSFQFENLDASPAAVTGTTRVRVDVFRPDATLLVSAQPARTTTDSVTGFDGVIDFGGTSGRTLLNLVGSDAASVSLPPPASDLTLFTGPGTLDLQVTGTGTSTAGGTANLATVFNTSAAATLTVTYTYVPGNAIRPGNYTVVQTAQPAGFLDGPESSGGAVLPGTVGTDAIPVTVAAITDVLPGNDFGETPISPAIAVVKLTNGTDNDAAPGPVVAVGSTVTFTYVVTNAGNVPLSGVTVRDDNGTPGDPSDDFNATLDGGDMNENGLLDLAETWTFSASRVATPGQYTNVATATGTATAGGATATATNPDNHLGAVAAIAVVKLTNGTDNDTAPGVFVPVGSAVTFTYVVTNAGNVPLSGVTVRDDNGTPGNPSDDVTATLAGGDSNTNSLLDLTETWTFTASRIATAGQHTNVATATGSAAVGGAATATNPDNHFGAAPAIAVVKLTNGADNNTAPGLVVPIGSLVTFTYAVTNPGNVPLSGVVVADDNGTPGDPSDDFAAAFTGGDANTNGLLDPAETWTFTASRVATAGQYTNLATAAGTPPPGAGAPVAASDPDNHFGEGAAVHLAALTNGRDNNAAPGRTYTVGSTVVFVYMVANPGTVPLTGVTVVDDAGTPGDPADDVTAAFAGGDANGDGLLDPTEVWVFSASWVVTAGQHTNVATVTALPAEGGAAVSASDVENHFGFVPVIAVGAGPGSSPLVRLFNADGSARATIQAFDPGFLGGVRVAVGDVTGDGVNDVVAGAGPGAGSHVKVFDGVTNAEVRSFFAFPGFAGGVFVGAGDVDGDGFADLIVGAGAGGGPHVKVFSGATGEELRSFFAFAGDFAGGVAVAGGDVTGDGHADVVVGSGTGSHVKVFDGVTYAEVRSFFAFPGFAGGVFVGAGDIDCDGRDEIVVGVGPGGGPHVKVYDGATNVLLRSFFAFAPGSGGGVRVAAGEVNTEGMVDLIVGAGTGSEVKVLDGLTNAEVFDVIAFDPATQGVFVS
jgi:hypothetical protein